MAKQHTAQDLADIYLLAQGGRPLSKIADDKGLAHGTVQQAYRRLKRYLSGKAREQDRQSKSYREAVRIIRRERRTERQEAVVQASESRTEPQGTTLADLRRSFEAFQEVLAGYINAEFGRRNSQHVAEVEALRSENERLQAEVRKPQTLNWIDTLEDTLSKERS